MTIPLNRLSACNNITPTKSEIPCHINSSESANKQCCDSHDNDNNTNHCNGSCNNNCHCPASVNISIPINNFTIPLNSVVIYTKETNWAYLNNMPEPVYLPIWQPPKI